MEEFTDKKRCVDYLLGYDLYITLQKIGFYSFFFKGMLNKTLIIGRVFLVLWRTGLKASKICSSSMIRYKAYLCALVS